MANKYGLSRNIQDTVKRQVRESCGFGCVICGSIPYEYDHLVAQYVDTATHDPDDIVLLCPTHHTLKTNGVLDTETILVARKHRRSADSEFRFKLPGTKRDFEVQWGGSLFKQSSQVLQIDDVSVLSFSPSDNPLEPLLIDGTFRDRRGNILCQIRENELVAHAKIFGDFTMVKDRLTFKHPSGEIALHLILTTGRMKIDRLFHVKGDAFAFADADDLFVGNSRTRLRTTGCTYIGNPIAILLKSKVQQFSFENVDPTQNVSMHLQGMTSSHNGVAGISVE